MADDGHSLRGKVAVVTGATRGLGRAIAVGLGVRGADIVLAGRSAAALESAADDVRQAGRAQALAVITDISNEDSVDALARKTIDKFGRVDILINNAGILTSSPLLEQSVADFDATFATNVRGTFLVTRALGRHLVAQGSGKIVNVASNFALKGVPAHTAYSASKAAVIALTRSLAIEWARHNVQVNAIAPGYFATEMTADVRQSESTLERVVRAVPARRMGEPDELLGWVELLSGPGSDFMTGQTIVIDGGQSAK